MDEYDTENFDEPKSEAESESELGTNADSSDTGEGTNDGIEGSDRGEDDASDWRSYNHTTIVNELADRLHNESATERVYTEKDYAGVTVDVVQKLTNDDVILWEVKRPDMQPGCKYVYHLLMYHDHYAQVEGKPPEKVKLLSNPLSGNGQSDLDTLDSRNAPTGGSYDFEQVKLQWLFDDARNFDVNPAASNSSVSDVEPAAK